MLQTVVEQCVHFVKDPWSGPVSKDGKVPCNPSVNAAGFNSAKGENEYKALASKSFTITWAVGRKQSTRIKVIACSVMVSLTTRTTSLGTAPSSGNLGSSLKSAQMGTIVRPLLMLLQIAPPRALLHLQPLLSLPCWRSCLVPILFLGGLLLL